MKCMVIEQFKEPLVMSSRQLPVLGPDDVLVRVGACGICRTDLKIWQGLHPFARTLPLVPGHEIAGEIFDVGANVGMTRIGEHVVVFTYLSCGECEFCTSGRENLCSNLIGAIGLNVDGGYSEFVKIPAANALTIGKDVPFHEAAIIPDAITTSYHALVPNAKIQPGETVAIVGAGGLGLHAVQIAKALEANVIAVDVDEQALLLAEQMGADKVVRASTDGKGQGLDDLCEKGGVHAVIDFTGAPSIESKMLEVLRVGGKFVSVGYNPTTPFMVNSQLLVANNLEILGSRACTRADLREAIKLVSDGHVKPFISTTYPLTEANEALKELQQGNTKGRSVLIV